MGNFITLENVKIENERNIFSDRILIKMCSPLLVRKHEEGKDKYLAYNDEEFEKYFDLSLHKMFANLGLHKLDLPVEIIPLKPIKTVVNTFGNQITGNVGIYMLRGNKEILAILQKLGIGSRRRRQRNN